MPQSKEKHKEYMRLKRQEGSQDKGSQSKGSQGQGSQDIPKELMPVVRALSDIEKRAKLRLICQSLSDHKMLKNVRYGYYGPDMSVVSELLSAF